MSTARSDAPLSPGRRRRWPWIAAALVALAAAGGVVVQSRAAPEPLDPALIVTAARAPLAIEVIDVGRVRPLEQVEIESKVAGRVARVLVDEGDRVAAGDVLIELERRDFSRAVARELSALRRARALYAHTQRDVARRSLGAREGLVTGVDLELAEHQRELARLDLGAARVGLASARDRLADARITAPAAGTVIRRSIEPGEMVVPGVESTFEKRSLLTIADLSRLIVEVELNQIDVAKVRIGQRVSVTLDALPNERFSARVTEIAAASVRPPGKELDVFPVEALLERSDPRIKPGMTADVRIHVEERSGVVSLPLEAVRRDAGKAFVERVVDGERGPVTERVEVVLGLENDRAVEIAAGLSEGDRVLVAPPSAEDNETRI